MKELPVSSFQHVRSSGQNNGESVDERLNRRIFDFSTRLESLETRRSPIEQSVKAEIGNVCRVGNVINRPLSARIDVRVRDEVGGAAGRVDPVVDGGRGEPEHCAHAKIEPILSHL